MLNLNYNINNSLSKQCIGVLKYNYSASIVVAGGGAGGVSGGSSHGGGGGGGAASQSISIVPNVIYTINVNSLGAPAGADSEGISILNGFDDNDNIPITFLANGGKTGGGGAGLNGGNSGSGSIDRAGVITNFSSFNGGTGTIQTSPYVRIAAGGGASNSADGANGVIDSSNSANGGNGASGITGGGGGGCLGGGPTPQSPAINGLQGVASSGAGVGGHGKSQKSGEAAGAGTDGVVLISYIGKTKGFVTGNNVQTTFDAGTNTTTHRFLSGSGTFVYTFPFPYEEPVTPYQQLLCPPEYKE